MNVENIEAKHTAIAPLIYGMLSGAFLTILDSISTGEIWRITFAVIGFVGFAGLASFYSYGLYRQVSEQKA